MFGRLRGSMAMVASLAIALGAGAGFTQPAPTVMLDARRAKKGLFGGVTLQPLRTWRYGGPGTTMAQQQRASRKAKNVERQRSAARGNRK